MEVVQLIYHVMSGHEKLIINKNKRNNAHNVKLYT